MPNAWDAGSAKLFASLGFAAIATTSSGLRGDARPGRRRRQRATRRSPTPPSSPRRRRCRSTPTSRTASPTTRPASRRRSRAAADGRRGRRVGRGLRPRRRAPDPRHRRWRPSGSPRRSRRPGPSGLVLTARAENLIHGVRDLDDTIRRLQAYQEAGADVLYAPGLFTIEDVRAVVDVGRPAGERAAARRGGPDVAGARRGRRRPGLGRRDAGVGGVGRRRRRPPGELLADRHPGLRRPRQGRRQGGARRRRCGESHVRRCRCRSPGGLAHARVQHRVQHDRRWPPSRTGRYVGFSSGEHRIEHERRQQRRPRPQDQHAAPVAVAEVHQAVVEVALVGDVERLAPGGPADDGEQQVEDRHAEDEQRDARAGRGRSTSGR